MKKCMVIGCDQEAEFFPSPNVAYCWRHENTSLVVAAKQQTLATQQCFAEAEARQKQKEEYPWYPCAWCDGTGVIEDAEHGDCECSACDGTGEASNEAH